MERLCMKNGGSKRIHETVNGSSEEKVPEKAHGGDDDVES